MFKQIVEVINNSPDAELEVVHAEYPVSPLMQFLSTVVNVLQLVVMAMICISDQNLPALLQQNKIAAIFGTYLSTTMLTSALTKTGAFEIYVGEKLIFSALAAGRGPRSSELIQGFDNVGVEVEF